MTTLMLEADSVAVGIELDENTFTVNLTDGRSLSVPLEWYPRLYHAPMSERNNWQLLGGGYAIEWPDLNEHIGIEGLLAGRRSGESEHSFQRWLHQRQ